MNRLQEDGIRIVQENRSRYEKMLAASMKQDQKIRERKNVEIKEKQKKIFSSATYFVLGGAAVLLVMAFPKNNSRFDYYKAEGNKILNENWYPLDMAGTTFAYNESKVSKAILNNQEKCFEENREDDTKYLIAGIGEEIPLNMEDKTRNLNKFIGGLGNEQYKNLDEYMTYLGYSSYDEYIKGVEEELAIQKTAEKGRGMK